MGVSACRAVYAYDAQNDFLTQVDYNDGQAGELQDWTYDPAGNRASASANPGSWSYDNLNRIVSSPFGSSTHDLAGSRLTGPSQTLTWDVTNRLTGLNGVTHRCRVDGMRVQKVAANGDTYRWHYDAQMPVEETRVVGSQTTIMRNIVGPRGIDIQFDGANAAFPLYDTHGNSKALLARSGSTFTTTAWRQYDVWGSLRTGSALGGASQRYCANLGHVTDDESSLIYMRARFYEPWTGRFVNEDPGCDGRNWYIFCSNDCVNNVDITGKETLAETSMASSLSTMLMSRFQLAFLNCYVRLNAGLLTIGIDKVIKNEGAPRINIAQLVQALNTYATSRNAHQITLEFNRLNSTPEGIRFFQNLIKAIEQENEACQIILKSDRITQLIWLIQAQGGG